MIRISGLKIKIPHNKEALIRAVSKKAKGQKPMELRIIRRSIDARQKPDLYYVYTVDASFSQEKKLLTQRGSKWSQSKDVHYRFPYKAESDFEEENRPVIVGAGPAGLFAGLVLARAGYRPLILERGEDVESRLIKVDKLFAQGILDEESNVQFGEGGAGTFSDGKLNTLVKDRFGRNRFVLNEFVKHGAPEEILYDAKPHIGTDILKEVVRSIREEIISCGGEIRFRSKVVGLRKEKDCITGIVAECDGESILLPARQVIFAIGHSARDTFRMLYEERMTMTPKAFAIGVRVEHPTEMINESMYGTGYPAELSAASYKLTHQCKNGRGIYSFCMCPGGYVVNSSSEKGRLCVNGMSYSGRDGKNSNSAIITTVTPEDFPSQHPLAGIEFQRHYEELAWKLGKGRIPVQLYKDFKDNKTSAAFGEFMPNMKGSYTFANLRQCLPDYITESLLEGMEAFGQKIKGYDREDAIISGVETRTSSPVRMERDDEGQSNLKGIYPCGEGAGYAGGITSAAMDGIKIAEAVAKHFVSSEKSSTMKSID